MTNLKQAREQGKLDQFIKEHEGDAKGDADQVNRTLKAMARKSKEAPKASSPHNPGD
jgi:hypothetical protein